ncbi:transcriptional regulator [Cellulomonas sp. A375-1]|uniref:Protein pafC n=1 Tax=Cellulomonas gelida TaxID=1712 RepID=A0A4Y3KEN8_9CELL|nr:MULTISPECIES: WYL domain-containing protein [Cellulomonas]KMM47357.1 transcriptional regulator [Cellulomonas sp. A375-1]GEA82849.1 protein pafC [Cellulomonas gelida]GGL34463.1 protein pafC [Cellulomonas gelida]
MAERASDRVVRLLGLVAFLDRHEGASVEELARQFGVTSEQVMADIDTLWVSGTPGYLPYDLIDFDFSSYERGVVRLTESRNMTRPLRLSAREGVALVASLRALDAGLSGALDDERAQVVRSALAKLTAAVGDAAGTVDVSLTLAAAPEVAAALATSLREGRRLHLRYVNAADVSSERDVDPIRLVTDTDRSYLLGWCHAVEGERLFRVDRILAAHVLDEPAEHHPLAPGGGEFEPGDDGALVTVHLASQGRWIAESTPVQEVRNLDDGSFEVDLRVVSPAWLRHLVLQAANEILDVRPASVAAEVASTARAALAAYGPLADPARVRPYDEHAGA